MPQPPCCPSASFPPSGICHRNGSISLILRQHRNNWAGGSVVGCYGQAPRRYVPSPRAYAHCCVVSFCATTVPTAAPASAAIKRQFLLASNRSAVTNPAATPPVTPTTVRCSGVRFSQARSSAKLVPKNVIEIVRFILGLLCCLPVDLFAWACAVSDLTDTLMLSRSSIRTGSVSRGIPTR